MKLKAYGISDVGLVRSNNEDAWHASTKDGLFIVADGLGGHQAGEVASKESVDLFVELFHKAADAVSSHISLRPLLVHVNEHLYRLGQSHDLLKGMGTTFVALHITGNSGDVCSVGDSRLYRLRRHKDSTSSLELITKDHLSGASVSGDAAHKGYLTRALGTHLAVEPDVGHVPVHPGDIFMLCTDGLSDLLAKEEMESVLLFAGTIEQKVRMLISLAKERGGVDNITVILIEISEGA